MGLMRRVLDLLVPPGAAWLLPGGAGDLADGLADTLERPRTFARSALAETLPYTATDMLEEWHEALGQAYDPTQTLTAQRTKLDAIMTATGGVKINDLNNQLHKELPNVDVEEISVSAEVGEAECGVAECAGVDGDIDPFRYIVTGTVDNDDEAARCQAILAHFAPLHLVPYSELVILTDSATAEVGLAVAGLAETAST